MIKGIPFKTIQQAKMYAGRMKKKGHDVEIYGTTYVWVKFKKEITKNESTEPDAAVGEPGC